MIDMNKNKSIVDRISSFKVIKNFKIGNVRFEKNNVYNRIDIDGEGQFFIKLDYTENGLEAVNEISLSKFRKNFKRIKNYISIVEMIKEDQDPLSGFLFDTIKTIVLNKDFNGLNKGWKFTRETSTDLFTYTEENDSDTGIVSISYSFDQDALVELFREDPTSFLITEWLTKYNVDIDDKSDSKDSDDINAYEEHRKDLLTHAEKESTNVDECIEAFVKTLDEKVKIAELEEQVASWKIEYIREANKAGDLQCKLDDMKERFSNVAKKNDRYKRTIESLLEQYQTRLDKIDIVDELEFDKIEQGTVLENIITVLKHINKMF